MKILFTGGGTAGHIFPIIALSRQLRKIYSFKDLQLFYLGPKDEFVDSLLAKEGIKTKIILAGKIRRYSGIRNFFQNLIDIFFKIPIGFFQAFFYILFLSPDLIFSKGGYGSLPTVFAGWLLLTPVFLHESDISPGLVNRWMSKFSLEIFVSFPIKETEYFSQDKIVSVGNPIRNEILEYTAKEEIKKNFNLVGEKPIILVLGGSQGAQRINDLFLQILPDILYKFELIHQAGEKKFKQLQNEAKVVIKGNLEKYYHPFPFLNENELKQAYQIADLIVSRAGSGSIFEIAAVRKPSILIPLPGSAQNHQIKNAYFYAKTGAAIVVEEANLTPHFFLEKLKYLFSQPEKLEKMSKSAKAFSKPLAAKIIAEYIIDYLAK